MKINRLTRRMFLQGLSGSLIPIPFLESLLPKNYAHAADAPIKRFVSILINYDYGHHAAWFPNGEANITNIPQPNQIFSVGGGHHDIRYQNLRDFAPSGSSPLSRVIGSTLSPYLDSVNIFRSLDMLDRLGHKNAPTLGGIKNGGIHTLKVPTIDYILSNSSKFNPNSSPLTFVGQNGHVDIWSVSQGLKNGVNTTNSGSTIDRIYNRLFYDGQLPENGASAIPHNRRDPLSRVLNDYNKIRNGRNISSSDKIVLDNAMDKMSDVLRNLTLTSPTICKHSSTNISDSVLNAASDAAIGKATADLFAAALMCDVTRIITFGAPFKDGSHDGETFNHQNTSHEPFQLKNGKYQWQRMADRKHETFKNFIAPFVQNLSSIIEPSNGKSLLYNSLVQVSMENGLVHGWASHPALLIGNAAGAIKSGKYIDYANRSRGTDKGGDQFTSTPGDPQFSSSWYGVPYNRLMVTILQAMGLSSADYENPNINKAYLNRSDIGTQNTNITNLGGYGHVLTDKPSPSGRDLIQVAKYDLKFYRNSLPIP